MILETLIPDIRIVMCIQQLLWLSVMMLIIMMMMMMMLLIIIWPP
jgi:hypothetical protein